MKKILYLIAVCLATTSIYAGYTPGRGAGSDVAEIPDGTYITVPNAVTDGLVMHFDWEDAAGGYSTNLVSGYEMVKATMTSSAYHDADYFGTMDVIQFDAIDDYIAVTSSYTYVSQYSSWTICMWVYAEGKGEVDNGFFFSKNAVGGGPQFSIFSEVNGYMNLTAYQHMVVDTQSNSYYAPFPLKELLFVCLYFNRLGTHELTYSVNAALQPGSRTAGTAPQDNDSTSEWRLGNVTSTQRTWDGQFGVFRVYDRTLSTTEVEAIYVSDRDFYSIQ